jgi:hypothetical protein
VHATVYWRVGLDKFGATGGIFLPQTDNRPIGYIINPDQTVSFNPDKQFNDPYMVTDETISQSLDAIEDEKDDWRNC